MNDRNRFIRFSGHCAPLPLFKSKIAETPYNLNTEATKHPPPKNARPVKFVKRL